MRCCSPFYQVLNFSILEDSGIIYFFSSRRRLEEKERNKRRKAILEANKAMLAQARTGADLEHRRHLRVHYAMSNARRALRVLRGMPGRRGGGGCEEGRRTCGTGWRRHGIAAA